MAPRDKNRAVDRGSNARKPLTLLLNDEERELFKNALAIENETRDVPIGLGTKLRLLGLAWAAAAKR